MATGHLNSILKHRNHKGGSKISSVKRSLESLEVEDSPLVRRGKKPSSRHAHSRLHQWNQTIPSLSEGYPATLVLENHIATSTFESCADNFYNDHNMMQALFEQEAGNSLYRLGDFIATPHLINSAISPFLTAAPPPPHTTRPEDRPLPNIPDNHHDNHHYNTESISDYATINEEGGSSGMKSHDIRRERHLRELKRMTEDFSKPLTELGIESTDREWNQWLEIQGLIDDRYICAHMLIANHATFLMQYLLQRWV